MEKLLFIICFGAFKNFVSSFTIHLMKLKLLVFAQDSVPKYVAMYLLVIIRLHAETFVSHTGTYISLY